MIQYYNSVRPCIPIRPFHSFGSVRFARFVRGSFAVRSQFVRGSRSRMSFAVFVCGSHPRFSFAVLVRGCRPRFSFTVFVRV